MVGWLLKRLEEGIESRRCEHVNLVNQVDLVGATRWGVGRVLAQGTNALDAIVARPVDLHDIEATPLGDFDTGIANTTGIVRGAVLVGLTVQRLGKDACRGGLPDAARPDKEVGLGESIPRDGILESPGNVLLANDLLKFLRPVFSCKDAVAHRRQNLGGGPRNVADKFGNAFAGQLNLIHAGRITAPDIAFTAGTEGCSGNYGDFLRVE